MSYLHYCCHVINLTPCLFSQFTIKRRPLLHVINFLLPILFFLSLDLASFLIADHRGEKLGFKVTVLLAISVLLLILNEILPSMSNKTPLIGTVFLKAIMFNYKYINKDLTSSFLLSATYCIVIFALMLLSLLETILVTYLMEKESHDNLRLQDKWDNECKQDNMKNCSAGETHAAFKGLKHISLNYRISPFI